MGDKVIMEKWYSYTAIISKYSWGSRIVVKDSLCFERVYIQSSDNGQLYIDAATNNKVILRPEITLTSTMWLCNKKRMKITITVAPT
jgi:hypothetical protein